MFCLRFTFFLYYFFMYYMRRCALNILVFELLCNRYWNYKFMYLFINHFSYFLFRINNDFFFSINHLSYENWSRIYIEWNINLQFRILDFYFKTMSLFHDFISLLRVLGVFCSFMSIVAHLFILHFFSFILVKIRAFHISRI